MKRILPFVLVAALVGAYVGYKMYNKEHPNLLNLRADHQLTAEGLIKAYDGAEGVASIDGSVVDVTGTIADVSKNADGQVKQFTLLSDDVMTAVSLSLDEAAVGQHTWKKGDQATWRCRCDGKLIDIELVRCVHKPN